MKTVIELQARRGIVEEAADWMARFDRDEPLLDVERDALREWMNRSRTHRDELRAQADMWGKMNVLTELAVPSAKPKSLTEQQQSDRGGGLYAGGVRWAAVATIVVGLFVGGIWWSQPDPYWNSNGLYATAVGQQNTITLGDGSTVMLNTNSQIKVEFSEGYRDIRLLQGEAHFTVAKNADKPFRVNASRGRVEAVGTAFNVRLNDTGVDVSVTEGKVKLASINILELSQTKSNSVIENTTDDELFLGALGAGQVATIAVAGDDGSPVPIVVLEKVDTVDGEEIDRMLSWREGFLLFSGDSLAEVIQQISRYTTIKIDVASDDLKVIRIGGRFPVGETEIMFAALEESFGLVVTQLDHDHVVISARN